MKTIAVKQKTLEKQEPTVRCGNFARPRDWMASFLDFQISKLEERCVEIRAGMDAKLSEIKPGPNMELTISSLKRDLAQQTIGKERAALFRHYRVVARKQGPDVVKRGNSYSTPAFRRDNGH